MEPLNQNEPFLNVEAKKPLPIKINQKCSGNNSLHSFCLNNKCKQKNKFICQDQQCQCYQMHQACLKGSIKFILKNINNKLRINNVGLKEKITSQFTNFINKVSQNQQKIANNFQKDLKFIKLMNLEKQFYQLFIDQKTNNFQFFNGTNLQTLWTIINQKDNNSKINQQLKQKYQQKMHQYKQICNQIVIIAKRSLKNVITMIKEQINFQNFDFNINQSEQQLKGLQNNLQFKSIIENLKKQKDHLSNQLIKVNKKYKQCELQCTKLADKISIYQQQIQLYHQQINDLNLNKQIIKIQYQQQSQKNANNVQFNQLFARLQQQQQQLELYKKNLNNLRIQQQLSMVGQINNVNSLISQKSIYFKIHPKFCLQIYPRSSILKNHELIHNLINFFPQQILEIKFIFKASQNNFDIKRYYQKCGNLKNTVIICETNKNKIIGGYTPLQFNTSSFGSYLISLNNNPQYKPDPSNSSFIFSLTCNDKFLLKNNQKAICIDKNRIIFGNNQLRISGNAYSNNDNMSNFSNNFYENKKYKNDKQSYLKFNGNENTNFTIKQWEVYQIQYVKPILNNNNNNSRNNT